MFGTRRKWGKYWVLWNAPHWKFKILRFDQGGRLSHQKHYKRGELWLVLKGSGSFIWTRNASKSRYIIKGSSMMISPGEWHSYYAHTKTYVLEIQVGKCEEEDIERR